MPDRRFDSRTSGKQPKKYKFVGSHENLVTGCFYTLREIAAKAGIKNKTMHSRMVGKAEVGDKQVRATEDAFGGIGKSKASLYDRLETSEMKQSDKWLRMRL
jgi:hypothetical protein